MLLGEGMECSKRAREDPRAGSRSERLLGRLTNNKDCRDLLVGPGTFHVEKVEAGGEMLTFGDPSGLEFEVR